MKLLLRLIFLGAAFLLFGQDSQAQLRAYAGPDNTVCDGDTAYRLGGSPSAFLGNPPYTYKWSAAPVTIGSTSYPLSYFLNDTTLPDPKFRVKPNVRTRFYLEVTDDLGLVATDSVDLEFSTFVYLTITPVDVITQGDSVQLVPTVRGGVGTLRYYWIPGAGLDDSSLAEPWAKPDTTTTYHLIVMDSGGCVSMPVTHKVIVYPLGMDKEKSIQWTISPNPVQQQAIIRLNTVVAAPGSFQLYDAFGKLVKAAQITQQETVLERSGLASGLYFYALEYAGQLYQGKILLE